MKGRRSHGLYIQVQERQIHFLVVQQSTVDPILLESEERDVRCSVLAHALYEACLSSFSCVVAMADLP